MSNVKGSVDATSKTKVSKDMTPAVVEGKTKKDVPMAVESCVPGRPVGHKGKPFHNKMTNNATIVALFHIYLYPEPLFESQTNIEAVRFLEGNGLIEATLPRRGHGWEVTERGQKWLDAVLNLPLPVSKQIWEIPTTKESE